MARSNDNLKFTGLAVVVIAAAFGVGYFVLGGQHPAAAPEDTTLAPVSAPRTASQPVVKNTPPPAISPRRKNSDYTAPGAPAIRIVEERTPSLTVTHIQPAVPADTAVSTSQDSEASQEARTPSATPSPSDTGDSSQTGDTASSTPATPLIPPPPTPVNASPPATGDSTQPPSGHSTSPDTSAGAKAQYRVQAGSFATSDNARQLADTLHGQGYAATTHAEQDNGKTVYKVQVGAYRSRAAADKAAADLQKSGYPAYSSPIGP